MVAALVVQRDRLRRRTVRYKGTAMTLTWLPPASLPGIECVTAASVVPFTGDGGVVLARLARGLEIPGGEVAASDPDPETAARREAWEEARIILGPLALIQLARVEYLSVVQHIVVYTGWVASMPPFVQEHESSGRVVVSPDEYVERVRFGNAHDRRLLITQAMAAVGLG
jgi:8-oxo-dGTP diphosphatase